MGMVAPEQRIASAFTVLFGQHGDVSQYARQRGVCRQWVYREAQWVALTLEGTKCRDELQNLQERVRQLEEQKEALQQRLAKAVVLDEGKQEEFAIVGQARGVSLTDCKELLEVLIPGEVLSVATLGRRTKAAGEKAGKLLEVVDEWTRAKVQEAAADEIYVRDPVLMVLEPASLCWVSGRLSDDVSGKTWAEQFQQ